jgi:hypothetical protein
MKFVTPMFIGIFCSMFLCAFLGVSSGYFEKPAPEIVIEIEEDEVEEEFTGLFAPAEKTPDVVLEYYRNPEYRDWVIEFFTAICSSGEIARAILNSSDEFDIPPALAFALCWEESRFNPNAINRQNRNGSVDRGLFQLNNRSFPYLDITTFYNINSNVRYGLGHLRYCLNSSSSEVSALAIYNAGAGRVKSTGAPEVTLNYTNRILENRRKIENHFNSRIIREEKNRLVEIPSE